MFFPLGSIGGLALSCVGVMLFSAYIVYDTFLLAVRYDVDDYIWASIQLYLDVINLFLRLLDIISKLSGKEQAREREGS